MSYYVIKTIDDECYYTKEEPRFWKLFSSSIAFCYVSNDKRCVTWEMPEKFLPEHLYQIPETRVAYIRKIILNS